MFNYWEWLNKECGLNNRKDFERQQRARARKDDKFHFLHKTTSSRLGRAAALSTAQKPTEGQKENEETQEYVANKTR